MSVVLFVALLSLADGLVVMGELGDTNEKVGTVANHTELVDRPVAQRQRMRMALRHSASVSAGPFTVSSSARFHRLT
ncbi:hypothetical protein GCM10009557_13660 [Virgisporangium ochraceum]|uniref:Uncharacterized protein n=1 Tax=Virgisporangium ochraceum TaxID=65505 RepID=A0A8J4A126_9ACTN|nr:hypothetical protein Voc01_061570 [Virgisporangium ochraceum]